MTLKTLSTLENEVISEFVSKVRANQGANLVSIKLFGSRAKGKGTEESDVDILVLLKRTDLNIKNTIWDIANDIFLEKWINISPLVLTEENFKKLLGLERLIAKEIEKDGIPL